MVTGMTIDMVLLRYVASSASSSSVYPVVSMFVVKGVGLTGLVIGSNFTRYFGGALKTTDRFEP